MNFHRNVQNRKNSKKWELKKELLNVMKNENSSVLRQSKGNLVEVFRAYENYEIMQY